MSTADAELDSQMTNFFKVIGAMKRLMRGVDTNVEELARITSTMQREIDSDGSRKQATQIVRNTDEALKIVAERLKKLTERVRSRQRGIAEDRIYEGIVTTLNREFTALMQRYQQAEGEYRERCREEVVRQYRIAHPEASREKLEEIKYSDDNPAVFRSALMEAEKGIAQNRLADIQEKHADIVELSRSIHELHQLFVQMATLVEEQGEMVHNIASNVQKARDYVAKAEVELGKALKSQSSARKKARVCVVRRVRVLTPECRARCRRAAFSSSSS